MEATAKQTQMMRRISSVQKFWLSSQQGLERHLDAKLQARLFGGGCEEGRGKYRLELREHGCENTHVADR